MIRRTTLAASVSVLAMLSATIASADASADAMANLEAAAKAEGMLTTIALPHSWCGYGDVIAGFKKKYPEITINELNPDGGSADELEAVRSNKDNTGPQAPDVLDIGLAYGPQAKEEGLIQPYKVATWDEIPDDVKDADGSWYGDYYGVMAIAYNKDLIENGPATWEDLQKPEYAASFALTGDPRTSNQPILAVMAMGMARGGEAGEAAGTKGLEFMAELNKAGNFVPVSARAGTMAQGQTPIIAGWDYNLLAWRDGLAGNPPIEVLIPAGETSLAGVYVQAISAYAPHPNAAKLWMEYLYSDEGQLGWLTGYCHPIRFNAMTSAGKIPQDLLDKLPPAEGYARAVFPTLDQQAASKKVITEQWDTVVGANVE